MQDPDMELVQQGKQCMSCRFDINDGMDYGEPRVCEDCQSEALAKLANLNGGKKCE